MKTAVILFNLGGPDSKESIRPFLFNFFMDKNIIRVPQPLRFLIANQIANSRTKKEAGTSYGHLGDKSPLLANTQAQAAALDDVLGDDYQTFVCMRYWHPMADEVAQAVKQYNPDNIVLLPLYPQFSTTTTRSSLQVWNKAAKKIGLNAPAKLVCCYPFGEGYVSASAELVRASYDAAIKATGRTPRVLFSAHGLPEDVIADGDPYKWQCEESARRIVEKMNIPDLDWVVCYQSRVGPKKWIGPSTEEELESASKQDKGVVVYPHAFTQEHVETLVEIELEYREKAHEFGVPYFARVPTVSLHPSFISDLAHMARKAAGRAAHIAPDSGARICPAEFKRCCCQDCDIYKGASA